MKFMIAGALDFDGNLVNPEWTRTAARIIHLHTDATQREGFRQLEEMEIKSKKED